MEYKLEDLIDIPQFQMLQDKLNEIYSFPSAIIDNSGKILTATAWQDICTRFHRINAQSQKECISSDRYILDHIHEANPAVSYRCPHGMVDNATPIIIDGRHLGNFFTGQLFLEKPDLDFFKKQAQVYGFDETSYLQAVEKVPIWTQQKLDKYLAFIKSFTEILAKIGLNNLKEIETRKKISASEEKFRNLFETMAQGVVYQDENGAITSANPAAQHILGLTLDQMQGRTSLDPGWRTIHEDGSPLPGDEHPAMIALRTGKEIRNVVLGVFNPRQEKYRWIIINAIPQFQPANSRPYQVYATFEDITERKQAEILRDSAVETLRKNTALLNATQLLSRVGGWEWDVRKKTMIWTEETYRIHDIDPGCLPPGSEEHITQSVECYDSEGRPAIVEAFRACMEKGQPYDIELPFTSKTGRHLWIRTTAQAEWENGQITHIIGNIMDITERKQAELALQESEEKYRTVADFTYDWEYWMAPDGSLPYVSPSCQRITGYTAEEFQKNPGLLTRIMHSDSISQATDHLSAARATPEIGVCHLNFHLVTRTGKERWIDHVCQPVFDTGGQYYLGRRASNRDITEQKQAQDAHRESEERNRTIFEQSPIGIGIATPQGKIVSTNRAMETMFGYAPGEMEQMHLGNIYVNIADRKPLLEKLTQCGVVNGPEIKLKRKNGTSFDALLWMTKTTINNIEFIQTMCQDITERKQLAEKMMRSEKLAGLGTLAAGIAHEINSPLQVVTGSSEVLLNKLKAGEADKEGIVRRVERINENSWRIANIIRSLLDYARGSQEERVKTSLNSVVNDTLLLVEHQIQVWSNITVVKELAEDLPELTCDRNKIIQVLINLLSNARDAMPRGGSIIIRTAYDPEKERLTLVVCDSGKGIPESVRSRMFDPFFTTKPLGQGTGLGLSIVQGFVRSHGGEIAVDTQTGKGTTFTISLPLVPPAVEDQSPTTGARFDDQ